MTGRALPAMDTSPGVGATTGIDSPDLDLAVITCTVDVRLPIERCWARIRSFAAAGEFLDVPSRLIVGQGDIGSIRKVGDAILEAMVGSGDASNTTSRPKDRCRRSSITDASR